MHRFDLISADELDYVPESIWKWLRKKCHGSPPDRVLWECYGCVDIFYADNLTPPKVCPNCGSDNIGC